MRQHIDLARTRVQVEQEAVDAKLEAFDTFVDRVADVSTEPTPSISPGITATAGAQSHANASTDEQCRAVRTAFEETIRPHSVADIDGSEPLLATIRSEFTDSIAVALAPTTETPFSADLKRMLISEANARRTEIDVFRRALTREETHLETAADRLADIVTWITDADDTPLPDLGFEALKQRHETLADHRDRCETLAQQRQAFLQQTTNEHVEAGIEHRELVQYLYGDSPVAHPLLTTIVRLDAVCKTCQRAVRQHLVRRA